MVPELDRGGNKISWRAEAIKSGMNLPISDFKERKEG
jgi:hypothetical protein